MASRVGDFLSGTITKRDLLNALEGFDMDTPLVLVCDYGDRCHTQQALSIDTIVEAKAKQLEQSGYSQSGWAWRDPDEHEDRDEDEDEENDEDGDDDSDQDVIVLRG